MHVPLRSRLLWWSCSCKLPRPAKPRGGFCGEGVWVLCACTFPSGHAVLSLIVCAHVSHAHARVHACACAALRVRVHAHMPMRVSVGATGTRFVVHAHVHWGVEALEYANAHAQLCVCVGARMHGCIGTCAGCIYVCVHARACLTRCAGGCAYAYLHLCICAFLCERVNAHVCACTVRTAVDRCPSGYTDGLKFEWPLDTNPPGTRAGGSSKSNVASAEDCATLCNLYGSGIKCKSFAYNDGIKYKPRFGWHGHCVFNIYKNPTSLVTHYKISKGYMWCVRDNVPPWPECVDDSTSAWCTSKASNCSDFQVQKACSKTCNRCPPYLYCTPKAYVRDVGGRGPSEYSVISNLAECMKAAKFLDPGMVLPGTASRGDRPLGCARGTRDRERGDRVEPGTIAVTWPKAKRGYKSSDFFGICKRVGTPPLLGLCCWRGTASEIARSGAAPDHKTIVQGKLCPSGYREPAPDECQAIAASKKKKYTIHDQYNRVQQSASGCSDVNSEDIEYMPNSQVYPCTVAKCYCIKNGMHFCMNM